MIKERVAPAADASHELIGTSVVNRNATLASIKHVTVVQIDVRGEQLRRRTKLDFGFVGNTTATLRALLPHLKQNQQQQHRKESVEHYQKTRKGLDELAAGNSNKAPIHPQYVARVIDQLAANDAVFSCDGRTPVIWAARYLRMNGKHRLMDSFNHASMANTLPRQPGHRRPIPA